MTQPPETSQAPSKVPLTKPAEPADGSGDEKPTGPPARIGRNEFGRITVEPRAVERIAALAAAEVPDAGASTGRILGFRRSPGGRLPKVTAEVDGHLVFLDVELSVRWPTPVGRVTEQVRQHLFTQLRELVGLEVCEVNIEVVELVTESSSARVA